MRGDPPAQLDYLIAYYRGVYFATVALKGRLAKLGPDEREALQEVGRYQGMVKRYWDALGETQQLHRKQN
jgi:hypothetical protein